MNGTNHSFHNIESLEGRIAPASLVTVTFTDGALVLTSDNGAHEFSIVALNATTIKLSAGTDTLFHMDGVPDGDTLTLTTPVKSLSVTLDADADAIELVGLNLPGDLTLDLGDGTNSVSFDSVNTKGKIEVTGGTGSDTVSFEGGITTLKKDLSLLLGNGDNGFDDSATSLQIGGKFSYAGGTDGDTFTSTGSFSVKGNAEIIFGRGLNSFNSSGSPSAFFGKNLSLDSSASTPAMGDSTSIQIAAFSNRINGTLEIIDGSGSFEFGQSGFGSITNVRAISIITGGGASEISLANSIVSAKSLTIDASAASESEFSLGGTFGGGAVGNIKYMGGAGEDSLLVQILSGGSGKGSAVFDADLGAGDNEVQFGAFGNNFKSISITGGAGEDNVQVGILGGSLSNVVIDNGSGDASTQLQLLSTKIGQVKVINGTGAGTAGFGLVALDSQIGSISYESGIEANSVILGASGGPVHTNNLVVKKSITVTTGAGADTVDFQGVTNVKVGKEIALNLGDGVNVVQGEAGNLVTKALTVTGGAGSDTVTLASSGNLGAVKLTLGAGANNATLIGFAVPLTFSSFNLTSTTAAGTTDSLLLTRIQVLGKFDATLGAGDSLVFIDDSVFNGPFTANTGDGGDNLVIEGSDSGAGTLFVKPVTIDLGIGNDNLSLGGPGTSRLVTTKSQFKADGGLGTNTLANPASNVFAKDPIFENFDV